MAGTPTVAHSVSLMDYDYIALTFPFLPKILTNLDKGTVYMRGQSFKSILHVFEIYSKIVCLINFLVNSQSQTCTIHNLIEADHTQPAF